MEQNREPSINPCKYSSFISDDGAKNLQQRENSVINKWCWENWTFTGKRMKLETYPVHKNQLEMS